MNLTLRQEKASDISTVQSVIQSAFDNQAFSDQSEHHLVNAIRKSSQFIPELSLVAVYKTKVIGHVLMTPIRINNNGGNHRGLALAPISVHPNYQGEGVGSQLMHFAHKMALENGYEFIAILGHEAYYPRFGYTPAHTFGIQFPFGAPKENCMMIELIPGALEDVNGMIEYLPEFMS